MDTSCNLETVLVIEDKLWSLLELHRLLPHTGEQHRKILEAAALCDEWWEVTHADNINSLDKVFPHHAELRRAVRQALIAMLLSVTFVYASSIESVEMTPRVCGKAKKLVFFAHQNFLGLVQLILGRLPSASRENIWAQSLQAIILNKVASGPTAPAASSDVRKPALMIGSLSQRSLQIAVASSDQVKDALLHNTLKQLKIV